MLVKNLSNTSSILNTFISEIRNETLQKDKMRFRRNIERIGEILAYELSKSLKHNKKKVKTPLGYSEIELIDNKIVLCSILRAGLPLHNGLLNYFDNAENSFVSAYRKDKNSTNDAFDIIIEYVASPELKNKTLILADPMLATGQSLVAAYETLKHFGAPNKIHIVSVIASKAGINFISKHFPEQTNLWVAAIDEKLNNKGYIIPGLGDAGDLAFGEKL